MITELSALILGIVEGFTEFLPISSTAHLILTSHVLGIPQSSFAKTFEIAIQSGAILAVLALYWRKFLDPETLKRVVVAFIPTGVIGLFFYRFVKDYLFDNLGVILWALGIGGLLLILFEHLFARKLDEKDVREGADVRNIGYRKAALVGIFQSVAIVPGVSRAAATIVGGMLLGLRRETIVEFSFLLAVPTMLAATGLDLFRNLGAFSASEASALGIGLVVSFLMAIVSIKFLLRYIRTHAFTGFGIYRIALALIFLLII